jgi:hypothetical protein
MRISKEYFETFKEFCGINDDDFWEVIDSWRSDHIWESEGTTGNFAIPSGPEPKATINIS